MSDDLVKRLRQPWDADRSIMSQTGRWMVERKEAADRIEELEAQVRAADALVEAGNIMARALEGDYIVPGSANKWNAALATYRATKEGGA